MKYCGYHSHTKMRPYFHQEVDTHFHHINDNQTRFLLDFDILTPKEVCKQLLFRRPFFWFSLKPLLSLKAYLPVLIQRESIYGGIIKATMLTVR